MPPTISQPRTPPSGKGAGDSLTVAVFSGLSSEAIIEQTDNDPWQPLAEEASRGAEGYKEY